MKNRLKYKRGLKFTAMLFCLCCAIFAFSQSVLFEGPASLPGVSSDPPASGPGIRMMWYPDKGAFRAGSVNSTEWDKDSIGNYSAAFGINNIAKGRASAAFGDDNRIAADYSTAFGSGNRIFDGSVGGHSQIWGNLNFTDHGYTTVWGTNNIAHGSISTVFGKHNITKSELETVLGQFNDTRTSNNPTSYVATDYIFVIGNGSADNNRSNALEVYKNGNTVIKGALTLTKELNIGGVLSLTDSLKVEGPVSFAGNASINGALAIKNSSEALTMDDQLITVGNRSFIKVTTNSTIGTNRTILLSNGLLTGQILYIQNSGGILTEFELQDNGNVELTANHIFTSKDIIQLIWDGNNWLEVHFSNN